MLRLLFSGWNDIGYSFLVGEDGRAYEARGWGIEGAHTSGYNSVSHAISVIGTFEDRNPNNIALQAVESLIQCGINQVCVGMGKPEKKITSRRLGLLQN